MTLSGHSHHGTVPHKPGHVLTLTWACGAALLMLEQDAALWGCLCIAGFVAASLASALS